jgi:hypothetical protein
MPDVLGLRGFETRLMKTTRRPEWLIPAALILLSVVPVLAGSSRLGQLASGTAVTAENARFFASPVPVVIHIITVTLFCVLGALQFAPSLRRFAWHRRSGRVIAPAGILAAASGLWMTLTYPNPQGPDPLLVVIRLIVGSAMLVSITLALVAISRRDVASHGAWMTRGYAIGMGAGTQVLTAGVWFLVFGKPNQLTSTLLLAAGWLINVMVAELVIRRRRAVRRTRSGAVDRRASADALL